jgi:hypothetical protein
MACRGTALLTFLLTTCSEVWKSESYCSCLVFCYRFVSSVLSFPYSSIHFRYLISWICRQVYCISLKCFPLPPVTSVLLLVCSTHSFRGCLTLHTEFNAWYVPFKFSQSYYTFMPCIECCILYFCFLPTSLWLNWRPANHIWPETIYNKACEIIC